MATLSNDEDVLQICASNEELLDLVDDSKQVKSDIVILKFINKNESKISSFIGSIHKLLSEKNIVIKGFYIKGEHTCLIEVLLTSFLENWLATLVGARNNSRILSDKAKKGILSNAFGKFSIVLMNEIIYMIVVPYINDKLIDCQSSHYPYGLCNGNIINLKANCIRENSELVIQKIVNELTNGVKFEKIEGVRVENSSLTELSVRFIVKTQHMTDSLIRSLSLVFGSLTFCPSTLHFIPEIQTCKYSKAINSSLNAKQFWTALTEMDVLICNCNEQALAIRRKSPKSVTLTNPTGRINFAPSSSSASISTSIFDRLGPRINPRRLLESTDPHTITSSYRNLRITARFNTSSSVSASKVRSGQRN
ncbi:unnamed protein product [Chironomus riparius]|uniref:Uncharacterized protein n=1 Tax=Chironomus riparius TaxID=315576 RepID=A0A9N9S1L9_9DIPT|nr:unnamed protein product [Chironomus riparius]